MHENNDSLEKERLCEKKWGKIDSILGEKEGYIGENVTELKIKHKIVEKYCIKNKINQCKICTF